MRGLVPLPAAGMKVDCPLPAASDGRVQLADGGGGRRMQRLLREHVAPAVGEGALRHDAAVLPPLPAGHRPVVTTDGFVVTPWRFPGGDVGRLAVCGTLNDLAMAGAVPVGLTLGLIVEEGTPYATLDAVLRSARAAADEAGVAIVSGDTKVVGRGQGDGVYVTTTGLGAVPDGRDIGPWRIQPGDGVYVSGDIGRHGAAILSVREGLAFDAPLQSDCAHLGPAVEALLAAASVHCLRDATRGGLGAVLDELARAAGLRIDVDEPAIPVAPIVRAACELLGLDPLFLACEGRFVAVLPGDAVPPGLTRIGQVRSGPAEVVLTGAYGVDRTLHLPSGAQLPRIC